MTHLPHLLLLAMTLSAAVAAPGETRIARWQGDKTAAFMLMFDDGWPSHWQVAVPELVKRGLIATFYINPAKGEFDKFKRTWAEDLWKQGMVYGDHTMTHRGVRDMESAEREIGDCAKWIRDTVPGKPGRLLSYGQPGVGPNDWNITAAQLDTLLAEHHLISRPTFDGHGAVYHWQTTEQMLALADKAIATRGLEYLVIHGVERIVPDWKYQDFWALKQAVFLPLLDGIKERADRGDLWVTDHISAHQYETERDKATVKVLEATEQTIRLALTHTADAALYDLPVTLVTQVPAGWTRVTVTQGGTTREVEVKDGAARYEARPDGVEVRLARAG
ncbi:MAG: polysaccharide deacetylase family protein [Armatimonadetes bacterium]|nr:polysaccharide deacetylase family protein [Armatimonadota bacterium]